MGTQLRLWYLREFFCHDHRDVKEHGYLTISVFVICITASYFYYVKIPLIRGRRFVLTMSEDSCLTSTVNEKDWVSYRERKEWEDVEPVPQNDGPYPVVAIAYTERFVDVYDYFRGVLKTQEKSERVLELTKDALELNPANYTVWQYRREVLQHLKKDLKEELVYSRNMITANEKNYQVWHHRRVLIEWLQDPSNELKLTETVLASDAKNYHAWQYRQWVIKTFNLFEKELDFVDHLLKEDVRNNSAWNQRYFVLNNTTQFSTDVLEKEIDFTISKIKLVTNNESAWNYLRGLMSHCVADSEVYRLVCNFCEELYKSGKRTPYLLAYLVDLCEEISIYDPDNSFFNMKLALELCDELANKHDKIRCHYWNYISRTLSQKMNKTANSVNHSGDSVPA